MRFFSYVIGLSAMGLTACMPTQIPQQSTSSSASGAAMSVSSIAPSVPATLSGALTLGASNAPVSIVLFMNYGSPYSVDFERVLMPRLDAEFIQPGLLRVTIISVPLQKYPQSDRQARISICGVLSGSGAVIHRALFDGQTVFPVLSDCLANEDILQNMLAIHHQVISTLDVSLVPTYFIDGTRYTGLPEFADLRGQVNAALER
jgi:protein-disulfide isomerase